MYNAAYYRDRARQCRHIAAGIVNKKMIEGLLELAREFDSRAKQMESGDEDDPPPIVKH